MTTSSAASSTVDAGLAHWLDSFYSLHSLHLLDLLDSLASLAPLSNLEKSPSGSN
jgi:hypothetical protein